MGHSECHSLIPDRVRQFSMSENGLVATGDYCSFAYSAFARFEKWLISTRHSLAKLSRVFRTELVWSLPSLDDQSRKLSSSPHRTDLEQARQQLAEHTSDLVVGGRRASSYLSGRGCQPRATSES